MISNAFKCNAFERCRWTLTKRPRGVLLTNHLLNEIMLARYFQWLRGDVYASRKSGHKMKQNPRQHHSGSPPYQLLGRNLHTESVFVLWKLMISFTSRHNRYLLFMSLFKCLLWNPLAQAKNKTRKFLSPVTVVLALYYTVLIVNTTGKYQLYSL